MDVPSLESHSNIQTDRYPLLMEPMERSDDHEHIIDIARGDNASSSTAHDDQLPRPDPAQGEGRLSGSMQAAAHQTSLSTSNRLNSRTSSFMRRGDGYGRRRRSPLNSGLWISVELIVTVSQIIASVVVLSLSRHENPQAPLFSWVVGYASGCVATLPILYWRYRNRNQGTDQDSTQSRQGSSQGNRSSEPASYTAISVSQALTGENNQTSGTTTTNNQDARSLSARLNGLVDHFKMALDCFFAVWFVVGNVWIFGGHSSPSDAPKLYRLCIVFLTFSCIGYAMPFILCATICCCLPCIISILGFREEFSQTRGATPESINSLPTYKFKSKKNDSVEEQEINSGAGEGGVLAAGTEKERAISGEDAVCCICLAKYADNDELRELPCFHFFHVECVDKWLKINALCPLCKCVVGESSAASPSAMNSGQLRGEESG
ncbi:E3 ubiquitin-protein ligase At1g63170 [Malania oleifera]|uniref:E3 ubiquitin-protein ligase At1g63170 n=1 Tax=Malania oleifera TaxID=397392 RepID=UPI0025AE1E9C|nr:E3 ubiquitin-protein ligase At1g63170 [Malania oleifera]XP_057968137.1 E3 ubiquitin-protein ligase At1g63170 [Malania oleifera]XP_057968138.1 E3 ubiquitin-protein ligase At1g63170 [Malania oleifera]XP_057968139.1 E3 ubiquitin-protein ligase At1g63170 [Malania oleifera]XP_057968140.1 E3 ubiquitin-protein ligase At1g63170 [Malania oleifera]XP_057968141.1 E3 ubiquitin-protein ligase At1g63170 [Malania oleifera]XP_057968143.1 E3 ubiquitin-protein ligase At1g63170 [Malania oleifera]